MVIRKRIILIMLCIIPQLNYSQEELEINIDPIKDLPKEISTKYGTDIIPDKETALMYADIILKKRYINVDFDVLKPYEISLIAEDKVWEIKVLRKPNYYYHLRLNKNNGEVLNIWVDK